MRLMGIAALMAAMLSGCAPHNVEVNNNVGNALEKEVTSWVSIAPDEIKLINQGIEEAIAKGETWPRTPMQIMAKLLGDSVEWRELTLFEYREFGEGAQETVITFKQEGFLDDSVRGAIVQNVYRLTADGTWRVAESKRAFRCWRGSVNLDSFGAQLCG